MLDVLTNLQYTKNEILNIQTQNQIQKLFESINREEEKNRKISEDNITTIITV